MLPCALKQLFGIDCPTCGAQRSFALLLEGNFSDSFFMYPPLIPVLLLGIIWLLKFVQPLLVSMAFAKRTSWVVLAIVMVNYFIHLLFS